MRLDNVPIQAYIFRSGAAWLSWTHSHWVDPSDGVSSLLARRTDTCPLVQTVLFPASYGFLPPKPRKNVALMATVFLYSVSHKSPATFRADMLHSASWTAPVRMPPPHPALVWAELPLPVVRDLFDLSPALFAGHLSDKRLAKNCFLPCIDAISPTVGFHRIDRNTQKPSDLCAAFPLLSVKRELYLRLPNFFNAFSTMFWTPFTILVSVAGLPLM